MRKFTLLFNKYLLNRELTKFILVGLLCSSLNILFLYTLIDIIHFHYITSTTIAFVVINYIGYILNKLFTFERKELSIRFSISKYYFVMFCSLIINLSLMYFLVSILKLWYISASIFITILLFLFNFLLHKTWSFKGNK